MNGEVKQVCRISPLIANVELVYYIPINYLSEPSLGLNTLLYRSYSLTRSLTNTQKLNDLCFNNLSTIFVAVKPYREQTYPSFWYGIVN